ncbi:MAG: NADH-quinone oxidoreductase subunit J [Phenylobacterium sp.]|jgi:NADH-quinone oxidoreductase subunit J
MIEIIFIIAAFVCLASAVLTVTAHNVVHALLYLVVTMLAIALIFFLLGSSFAAALQIIVYAGAIMVLFIFVTMMLHQGEKSLNEERQLFQLRGSVGAFLLSCVLFLELIFVLSTFTSPLIVTLGFPGALTNSTLTNSGFAINAISVKQLGIQLYGPYKLLVVISALMLLSALISAIHIGRRETAKPSTKPAKPVNPANPTNKPSGPELTKTKEKIS